jgi:hypothetical protein
MFQIQSKLISLDAEYQYSSFGKAQHKVPEDGPIGPKHLGANKEIF